MRRGLVNLILAGLVAGSVYAVVTEQQHWPFSQYPIVPAAWQSDGFDWLRVFGVDPRGREFPLDDNQYIAPFDRSRLPAAFRRIADRPDARQQFAAALADVMSRYEILRRDRKHDGPALAAMRLYQVEWTIDPHAGSGNRAARKTLLAEVRP
jgi:hypothetical protein